jgi:hypothetical protein
VNVYLPAAIVAPSGSPANVPCTGSLPSSSMIGKRIPSLGGHRPAIVTVRLPAIETAPVTNISS